ncbi:hypothetical protein [Seonamhaeicola maritimus]|uniref:hypothetical protein n=1 Tax=Seonamhaeicola maritimus TaxID=2591822 RepID=UPI0024948A73|nr:hypothetical protein [Seonamhaeicola maritimus]
MKNIKKAIIYGTVLALFSVSCDEDKTTFEPLEYPSESFVGIGVGDFEVLESTSTPIEIEVFYANTNEGHTSEVTVDFTITGNATEGTHYSIANNKSQLSFPAGVFNDKIIIIPIDNASEDGDKEITFSLSNSTATLGYPGPDGFGTSIQITLTDDDCSFTFADLDGVSWIGTDNASGSEGPNSTKIETSFDGTNLLMKGLAYGWLTNPGYWDEVVVADAPVIVNMDPITGEFTIAEQYLCDTTWVGSPQPTYNISATGQYFSCLQKMIVNYNLIQGGSVLRSYTETIEF